MYSRGHSGRRNGERVRTWATWHNKGAEQTCWVLATSDISFNDLKSLLGSATGFWESKAVMPLLFGYASLFYICLVIYTPIPATGVIWATHIIPHISAGVVHCGFYIIWCWSFDNSYLTITPASRHADTAEFSIQVMFRWSTYSVILSNKTIHNIHIVTCFGNSKAR